MEKKSIWVTIIEKLPKTILAVAVLVCVLRAKAGDLPQMVANLTNSDIFCLTGWTIALTIIVLSAVVVIVYVKLRPKKQ